MVNEMEKKTCISAQNGAAVLQNCTNCTVIVANQTGVILSEEERGLLALYRQLSLPGKLRLIQAAVSLQAQLEGSV